MLLVVVLDIFANYLSTTFENIHIPFKLLLNPYWVVNYGLFSNSFMSLNNELRDVYILYLKLMVALRIFRSLMIYL